jgi:hypothetical protein
MTGEGYDYKILPSGYDYKILPSGYDGRRISPFILLLLAVTQLGAFLGGSIPPTAQIIVRAEKVC